MKHFSAITLIYFMFYPAFSQDSTINQPNNKPVKNTFETGILFDQQTVVSPLPKSFDFVIQHRFGLVNNGISDLFGIFATANIRMGLNFGITNRIMVGLGTTKYNKLQDINWKVAILRQTRSGSMPVSVSYFGNMVIDAREKSNFGIEENYKFAHRISYFHQLIISRKFSERISLQVSPSISYFNAVLPGYENFNFSLSAAGRVKITENIGIIAGYDYPFTTPEKANNKPSLSAGFEIGTSTHAFQLFITNYENLINQHNTAFNTYDMGKGEFLIGLNITVRF
jgi:hypothetical protein